MNPPKPYCMYIDKINGNKYRNALPPNGYTIKYWLNADGTPCLNCEEQHLQKRKLIEENKTANCQTCAGRAELLRKRKEMLINSENSKNSKNSKNL